MSPSLAAAFAVGRRVWLSLKERRRRNANYRALSAVDSRTLRDIGIDRSEILSLTLGDASGRCRDPRRP
jgi:uncharacterized protein YjiS (DUF1127 family)